MIPVKPNVAESAHIRSMDEYREMYERSIKDPQGFWKEQASEYLDWFHPPQTILTSISRKSTSPGSAAAGSTPATTASTATWTNARDKTAIIWAEDEPGEYEHITYRELKHQVARVANVLHAHGVKKGDRVCHLPADDPGAGLHDARLRPHRRRALGRLRRLLGRVAARPHPRRRLPSS